LIVFDESIEVIDIHLHLAEILMCQLSYFQIDEHVALQKTVVENQIDEEVFFIESEALLTCLEKKSLTKFKKKMLNVFDDRCFEIRFRVGSPLVRGTPGHKAP
jgi:hypothetical protein